MQSGAYHAFTRQLIAGLQADSRVIGLVLLGSTAGALNAGARPPDAWSDHDFFVITQPGTQEYFRIHLDWLPNADSVELAVRETAHGLKVLYASGHLLEFAVFDLEELRLARVNDYAIAIDRGGVMAAIQQITASTTSHYSRADRQRDVGMFLCLLLVGAGRTARGEAISGGVFIRTYALGHLLPVLIEALPSAESMRLDNLDVFRRFELVYPDVGAAINSALNRPPVQAGLGLLDVCETHLTGTDHFPTRAVAVVRAALTHIIESQA